MRTVITRLALLALLPVLPSLAQAGNDEEALKLFRAMQDRLVKAKSVSLGFSVELEAGGKQLARVKGTLAFTADGRARLEVEGKAHGEDTKATMTSDGKRILMTSRPKGQEKRKDAATPKGLGAGLVRLVTRSGLFTGLAVLDLDRGQPDLKAGELFPVTDLKLGRKEKVGDREAQVLTYTVGLRGKDNGQVTLWLDPLTHLPLKRVVTGGEGAAKAQITEVYTGIRLDAQLDAKQFELPK